VQATGTSLQGNNGISLKGSFSSASGFSNPLTHSTTTSVMFGTQSMTTASRPGVIVPRVGVTTANFTGTVGAPTRVNPATSFAPTGSHLALSNLSIGSGVGSMGRILTTTYPQTRAAVTTQVNASVKFDQTGYV
jgi:hypothetical protein